MIFNTDIIFELCKFCPNAIWFTCESSRLDLATDAEHIENRVLSRILGDRQYLGDTLHAIHFKFWKAGNPGRAHAWVRRPVETILPPLIPRSFQCEAFSAIDEPCFNGCKHFRFFCGKHVGFLPLDLLILELFQIPHLDAEYKWCTAELSVQGNACRFQASRGLSCGYHTATKKMYRERIRLCLQILAYRIHHEFSSADRKAFVKWLLKSQKEDAFIQVPEIERPRTIFTSTRKTRLR